MIKNIYLFWYGELFKLEAELVTQISELSTNLNVQQTKQSLNLFKPYLVEQIIHFSKKIRALK